MYVHVRSTERRTQSHRTRSYKPLAVCKQIRNDLNKSIRGSETGGIKNFRVGSDRSWDPPSILYNGHCV